MIIKIDPTLYYGDLAYIINKAKSLDVWCAEEVIRKQKEEEKRRKEINRSARSRERHKRKLKGEDGREREEYQAEAQE